MTRRIFWKVVMSDMAHLNLLVLQNQHTGTAGMAAGLGQPQQQRLIVGPLPYEQLEGHRRAMRGSRSQRVSW